MFVQAIHGLLYQAVEKHSEDGQMQGARSAATETYQIDGRGSEHRATPQMAHRSRFSTACLKKGHPCGANPAGKPWPDLLQPG